MPLGGGVGVHNDIKHFGSAKRGAYGGVVAYGSDGSIVTFPVNVSSLSSAFIYNLGGGFDLCPGPSGVVACWSVNANRQGAQWNRADISKPSIRLQLDGDNGQLRLFTAAPGANPISWTEIPLTGNGLKARSDIAGSLEVKEIDDTVTVSAGNTNGTGTKNIFFQDKLVLGIRYEVSQQPGGGANTFNIGDPTDPDRYGAGRAVSLGTNGSSMDGNATTNGIWSPTATQKARVVTDLAVTGDSLIVQVICWYIDINI